VPKKNFIPKTRTVVSEGPRGRAVPTSALRDQRSPTIGTRSFGGSRRRRAS
jgi:hypothetical protein